jgi:NAD(P)-dependent dehydrogenase (short-subunit alcohol dehydrogenase family)
MVARPLAECSAVVTGSTGGIGFEIAAQLAEAGVPRIAICGRDASRGDAAVAAIGARAAGCEVIFVQADFSRASAAKALIDTASAAFGAIDILVTSIPGHLSPQPFHTVPLEAFDEQVQSHVGSVVQTCHAALPHMIARGGGAIINLASDAAKIATPGEAIQGACKAAVVMFSRTLALEAGRFGIRVNVITPSIVRDTSAYRRVMASEFSQKLFAKAEARATLGVATPADIAPLAVFLAGPGAAKLTGQAISVNGGISAA